MLRRLIVLGVLAIALAGVRGADAGGAVVPGDADCDGLVTSIDASLILQYDAALIDTLPCPLNADYDSDQRIGSIDASIVLQRVAGFEFTTGVSFRLRLEQAGANCVDVEQIVSCSVSPDADFELSVRVEPPSSGYIAFQAQIAYDGLQYHARAVADEIVWPDSALPLRNTDVHGVVAHGGLTSPRSPFPTSTYRGDVVRIKLRCPDHAAHRIDLIAYNQSTSPLGSAVTLPDTTTNETPPIGYVDVDIDADGTLDHVPIAATLTVDCGT